MADHERGKHGPIFVIVNAFGDLRRRGIKDPVYARLVIGQGEDRVVGWLHRDPGRHGTDLFLGERFSFFIRRRDGSIGEVTISWQPNLFAEITGSESDRRLVLWFLHHGPRVAGGCHETIDNFHGGAADWHLACWDVYLVRCGSCNGKFRQPSRDALEWVQDPKRFMTSDAFRERVLKSMRTPLPTGERLTIRRIF